MGFPLVDEPWIMDDQWVIKGYGHEVEGENYVTSPLPPRFFAIGRKWQESALE